MKKRKVKNPLRKRIVRELLTDWSKYLVVSLFLILTIGFVSGIYVANNSMLYSADEGITKYKLEDGHFELKNLMDEKMLEKLESGEKADSDSEEVPVKIYQNFYRNEDEDYNNDNKTDGTIRVYEKNDNINKACVMDGRFPENENEIAIDRMHADNVKIKVGDSILVGEKQFDVVGLIAYVNYSTLHEKNTDLMFDAIKFDVAMVTHEGFERLSKNVHYNYAWHYENECNDDSEEKKYSDNFMKTLVKQTVIFENEIQQYIPRYANSAVNFATDDMGSDKAMGGVLLDILIVIIAFIFAVTISNTILKESSAIGTLRASGYTKKELVMHYLSMPVIVTFLSSAIGNVLGYTLFKKVVVSMYYNSYSLPQYKTIWNMEAFFKTTIIPVILMFAVNLIVILKMMQHTPLQFLRHDMKKSKRKKAVRLPRWKFINRFRLRIIFQNIPNYIILFAGIFFIMIMLAMAVGMPSTLDYYKDNVADMMFAKYQYVLNSCVDKENNTIETQNKNAEKFGMCTLEKQKEDFTEEISVYGISNDSKYVEIDELDALESDEVYISKSFSDKYDLDVEDILLLSEKYEEEKHEFKVAGIYDKCQSIAIFMPIGNYQKEFDLDDEVFTGFLCDSKIDDIDEENIATVITKREITKMCDQLDHSMGSYMSYFQVLCILLSAVMIYLLTKIIIEKNENAISMTKILGYENKEIASLYILSTTIVVIAADAVGVILGTVVMEQAWKMIMFSYSGWYGFLMEPLGYVKMFAFVFLGYLLVMFFDFKRIRKIPMDQALKNVE